MKPLTNLSQTSMIDLTEVQPKAQFSRNVPTRVGTKTENMNRIVSTVFDV